MKLYQIKQGTIEQQVHPIPLASCPRTGTQLRPQEADVEWAYKPYMNTAKRRKFLE